MKRGEGEGDEATTVGKTTQSLCHEKDMGLFPKNSANALGVIKWNAFMVLKRFLCLLCGKGTGRGGPERMEENQVRLLMQQSP